MENWRLWIYPIFVSIILVAGGAIALKGHITETNYMITNGLIVWGLGLGQFGKVLEKYNELGSDEKTENKIFVMNLAIIISVILIFIAIIPMFG